MVGIIIVQNFSISALRAAAAAFKQEELRRQQHHNTSRKRRKETGEHGGKLKKLKVTYNLWTHFDAFLSAGYLVLFLFFLNWSILWQELPGSPSSYDGSHHIKGVQYPFNVNEKVVIKVCDKLFVLRNP